MEVVNKEKIKKELYELINKFNGKPRVLINGYTYANLDEELKIYWIRIVLSKLQIKWVMTTYT